MHVGYGAGFQHLGGYSDRQFMREELGNCERAEPLGFDSVWVTEHHFDDYSISPDPCQVLSYIAGKTKHIKLGSMVIVVPWHDPVRLAEQISLLDHVSNGRYILGFGRGLARLGVNTVFGVSASGSPMERRNSTICAAPESQCPVARTALMCPWPGELLPPILACKLL